MYVPVEEEQNQTEAEQRIEKLVKKTRESGYFLGRTAFTERSEKLSLLKDIWEILDIVKEKESKQTQKRKQRRKSNGNGNRDRNEKKQRKINRKQENQKERDKRRKSEGEEEKKTHNANK